MSAAAVRASVRCVLEQRNFPYCFESMQFEKQLNEKKKKKKSGNGSWSTLSLTEFTREDGGAVEPFTVKQNIGAHWHQCVLRDIRVAHELARVERKRRNAADKQHPAARQQALVRFTFSKKRSDFVFTSVDETLVRVARHSFFSVGACTLKIEKKFDLFFFRFHLRAFRFLSFSLILDVLLFVVFDFQ